MLSASFAWKVTSSSSSLSSSLPVSLAKKRVGGSCRSSPTTTIWRHRATAPSASTGSICHASMGLAVEAPEVGVVCKDDSSHRFKIRPFERRYERVVRERTVKKAFGQCPKTLFPRDAHSIHHRDPPRDPLG